MEPLERSSVTVASRIMLPTYMVLCLFIGVMYIVDPDDKVSRAPVYQIQQGVLNLDVWGLIMLSLAGLMGLALIVHRRFLFAYALCCCALTWFIWGCFFLAAAITSPFASYMAPALPWFVSIACIASVSSLISKEI